MTHFFGYLKLTRPEDWKGLAGSWTPGRSAYELAHSWQTVGGMPSSISKAVEGSNRVELAGLTLDRCVVEMPVFLDSNVAPSMTDIMAYGRNLAGEAVVIAVEGKADEAFGGRVFSWIRGNSEKQGKEGEPKPTRVSRLKFLCEHLRLNLSVDSDVRYQLLHRTVSAVLEAQLNGAQVAFVIIHAFGFFCKENWDDFTHFLNLLGLSAPKPGAVCGPCRLGKDGDMPTFFLWCQDQVSDAAQHDIAPSDQSHGCPWQV